MPTSSAEAILPAFLERLAAAKESLLLLDYDGTLAPFQIQRDRAVPYPGVAQLLEEIARRRKSRVVLVTGRPIADLRGLLRLPRSTEAWGSYGLEHLAADGTYRQDPLDPQIAASLSHAQSCLAAAGLGSRLEVKPGGFAVHWRGLPTEQAESIQASATEYLAPYSNLPGLVLIEFDGGLELRVAHPDKGDAVASILNASTAEIPVAYLGDDMTDESAFQAVNSRGLSVLVRPEYRKTNAQIWLRPPHELIAFLQQWLECLSV